MHQVLHIRRFDIKQLDAAIHLLAQPRPIEIEKRMVANNLANHIVRDTRALPQSRQMELPDFSAAAHVMNQIVGLALAPNESHDRLPFAASWRSVRMVHYSVNGTMPGVTRGCIESVITSDESAEEWFSRARFSDKRKQAHGNAQRARGSRHTQLDAGSGPNVPTGK